MPFAFWKRCGSKKLGMAVRPSGSRLMGTALFVFFFLLPAGTAQSQSTLLEARVEVNLSSAREPIRVLERFSLSPGPDAKEIPISVLTPEPTDLISLQAVVAGQPLGPSNRDGSAFRLEEVRDYYWEGSIQLPQDPGEGGDSIVLQLSYFVEGGWEGDGRTTIPLLVPRWAPIDPTPRTFLARVSVPAGLTVTGSFPTSVLNKPPPGEAGSYEIALQGVPAMLILRMTTGRRSFLSLERGLDLVVVLILLVMGAFGVRYLRGRGP